MDKTPAIPLSSIDGQATDIMHESDVGLLRALVQDHQRHAAAQAVKLNDALRELETFAHSMAHDLRAPLRGIAGLTRGLVEDHGEAIGEDGRRVLVLISTEAGRMGKLIEDLAAYSQIGRVRIQSADINMCDLVNSAQQDLVECRAQAPSFRLGNLPSAYADRKLVRELLRHLLDNALKFTTRVPAEITVTGETSGGWSTYCVADNGIGFDPHYAHRLFNVFQRLHRPDDFPGSGMGLATVRRIVQRHGGKVWAEGIPNQGAKFYFTLANRQETRS